MQSFYSYANKTNFHILKSFTPSLVFIMRLTANLEMTYCMARKMDWFLDNLLLKFSPHNDFNDFFPETGTNYMARDSADYSLFFLNIKFFMGCTCFRFKCFHIFPCYSRTLGSVHLSRRKGRANDLETKQLLTFTEQNGKNQNVLGN